MSVVTGIQNNLSSPKRTASSKVKEAASELLPINQNKRQKLSNIMMSSGPVETVPLPPSAFRRSGLRLCLQRSISSEPEELKTRVRTIDCNELAKKIKLHFGSTNTPTSLTIDNSLTTTSTKSHLRINSSSPTSNNNGLPFLLLDCRGYLCYTDCHVRGSVHIACTDRFNRKRVAHSGSVLDLVSTNNRRNKAACNGQNQMNGKWRDVIVYDDGNSDLNLDDNNWSNPISFVLAHLIQENRSPIYLTGGIKEFVRSFPELCDTSCENRKDLNLDSNITPAPLSFVNSPLLQLSPSSSSPVFTNHCNNMAERYENEPPTQVLPYLYVGNARDANNPELLRKLGISFILSVTNTTPHSHHYSSSINKCSPTATTPSTTTTNENSNSEVPEFRTKLIPVSDNLYENLAPYFEEAYDFIEEARKSDTRVLIHCHAGISRSPTIAIAYIMKHINMTTLDAYAFVQRSRRIISPNLNFMGQLVEYESKLKGYASNSESSCTSSTSSNSSSLSSYSSSSDDCCIHEDYETQPNHHPIMMMTDD